MSAAFEDYQDNVTPFRPSLLSRIRTRQQLENLPDPEPLIGNTLDQGTVNLLAGYWQTFKSFVALDWAASIETGMPWMGRPTEKARVLYVAAEGAWGLKKRLRAWDEDRGETAYVDVLDAPVDLLSGPAVSELCAIVEDSYDVVFVDTISKCIPGADENSAKDMSIVVSNLYRIQRHLWGGKGAVVAVHHTGKDRMTVRGSSALEAGVDTVYVTEGDKDNLRLSRTKRKDGPREDVLSLRFHEVPGTGSGVMVPATPLLDSSKAERAVLAAMTEMFATTGASASDLMEVTGQSKSTFYRVRGDLIRTGVLEVRGQRLFLGESHGAWDSDSHESHGEAIP